jgi:hypothetical protein
MHSLAERAPPPKKKKPVRAVKKKQIIVTRAKLIYYIIFDFSISDSLMVSGSLSRYTLRSASLFGPCTP